MRRQRRGNSAIEMAVALPILLMLLGATVDFSWISLTNHQLGYAARVASRWGITGQTPATPDVTTVPVAWCKGNPPNNARVTKLRQLVTESLGGIIAPSKLCISVLSYTGGYPAVGDPEPFIDTNGNKAYDTGEPFTDVNGDGSWSLDQGNQVLGVGGDVAVYELQYVASPLTGLTPGLPEALTFTARVVVRNEPFLTK